MVFSPHCVEQEDTELLKNQMLTSQISNALRATTKQSNRNMIKVKRHREIKACQHNMNEVIFFPYQTHQLRKNAIKSSQMPLPSQAKIKTHFYVKIKKRRDKKKGRSQPTKPSPTSDTASEPLSIANGGCKDLDYMGKHLYGDIQEGKYI